MLCNYIFLYSIEKESIELTFLIGVVLQRLRRSKFVRLTTYFRERYQEHRQSSGYSKVNKQQTIVERDPSTRGRINGSNRN